MQQLSDISFSFLSTQTCSNCQLPVTCGPVYLINDLSILCGRCRMTAKDHFRNYAYEALASMFFYPCKNWDNHCPMRLRWNDSLDHETECDYTGCCTFLCTHPGAFLKGKRDPPQDETRMSFVPDNLLEYLECVICRGILNSSPVFIQSNGQNICHRCIYANGNPPNCRRNHPYEKFSEIFLFPCTFKNRGCRERLRFGRSVWKHEAECEFAPPISRRSPYPDPVPMEPVRPSLRPQQRPVDQQPRASRSDQQRPSVKQKGLVKTQTGHIWATITPTKMLFAPPDEKEQPEAHKQLMKSLAEKQRRQITRVDDIRQEMGRRNSETESISTNESYSVKTSGASTPDLLEYHRRPYIPPEDYYSRPHSRESGYQTGRRPYPEEYVDEPFRESISGQYPVLKPHQLDDNFDSHRRTSRRESTRGNNILINELKIKQDMIKRTHSIKGDVGSPYKQCNNLDDILEVNRRLK